MPATKSLRSGTWASTLLPTIRSAVAALGAQRLGQRDAEELDPGRDALGERDLGHVRGGLDAEHGHAERQEMLQQIAVVARQLDHQAVRAEREALL